MDHVELTFPNSRALATLQQVGGAPSLSKHINQHCAGQVHKGGAKPEASMLNCARIVTIAHKCNGFVGSDIKGRNLLALSRSVFQGLICLCSFELNIKGHNLLALSRSNIQKGKNLLVLSRSNI
eukprot:1161512-Pelagomonas_calceolata.AAC.34